VGAAPSAPAAGRGADGHFDKRTSAHFVLLQDVDIDETGGFRGSRRFEQGVLDSLETGYELLDDYLGLRPARKLDVVIYDPAVFDRHFAGRFRFAAAGFYAGVIRIRGSTEVHTGLVRVLNHELMHAALDAEAPSVVLPGWLNEGLAEWFEARTVGKRHLSGRELAALEWGHRNGHLFPLAGLSAPSFAHLGPDAASLAYLQSYGMVEFLARQYGERKLRDFLQTLFRSRDLHRSLSRVYRADLASLETRFLAELN
jgi:hypothetical protein